MLTSEPPSSVRPAYRPYRVAVAALTALSPHFTRVTFTGPDLSDFGTAGLDQRIKLLFPLPDGTLSEIGADDTASGEEAGSWYQRWLELPEERRNPIRTYTIRAVRPSDAEIDVDFVVHSDPAGPPHGEAQQGDAHGRGGPAAAWLALAAVGSVLTVVGPDARSGHTATGIDWHPGTANVLLLAGDETAAPAICAILESLPADVLAQAFIEVPQAGDELTIDAPARCATTWLARGSRPHGKLLNAAIRQWVAMHSELIVGATESDQPAVDDIDVDTTLLWDSPDAPVNGGFYAWLAGEAGAIKLLRRFLVSETGIDRNRVAFMGYWRIGKSEN